ncbi:methylthioribose-1-phosphate isomerase [Antricoccus suffuscus]|uniref:Methylthioribose-1-phosphate isomerase n=1 Tax=Antricoccus suffuscus TaxID=1629062 RepID=A0A2T0Z1G3_9ACTN|nr:S-methyl-5-thioribose-1-phosphate isomerase [Antricoccus suffuscus]PRZ30175.1 methylthioribose-1-phosphate isomerase [Antricoccus suffuscus]
MRAIDWTDGTTERPGHIRLLDQSLLPQSETVLEIDTVDDLIDAIKRLAVRGAPALGVAGALGVALAVQNLDPAEVDKAIDKLRVARPTAVNLALGVDLARAARPDGAAAVLAAALKVRDDDIAASSAMAKHGAALLGEILSDSAASSARLMTICNTGGLAAVERGTALGVVQEMHLTGRLKQAIALETRPLLQGSRLTAWELLQMGAPFDLIVDSAAASILAAGGADAVLVGADRIAANGDTANKIGTFALALAADYAGVPFIVVAPESTVDTQTASGAEIDIEDRGSTEVAEIRGMRLAPEGIAAANPAFDVTPAKLITAIVTDKRVIRPDRGDRPDQPL